MDWDKLKIFHAVAEAGSFTNATINLNLSQSAISRQIQSLEQDLKVQLFERHARGLTLTENGEYLFKTAHDVISKLKEVESTLGDQKNKPSGKLTITTVMPFIIRGVKLWGINSVTASIKRREFVWNEVKDLIDFEQLEKSIKTVNLEDLIDIFPKMLKGETSGRYIVDPNK
jgi:molybdenum-dependent DNA-binding transcriptional regulator ModE